MRNLIDSIESNATSTIVLAPLQINSSTEKSKPIGIKYSASTVGNSNISSNHPTTITNSTDTDDAKLISSRVRSNSSNQEISVTKSITSSSSSSSALAQSFYSNNQGVFSTLPFNKPNKGSIVEWNSGSNQANNSEALANLVKQYGVSKRNALMKWCQERTQDYKSVEIKNFSSSWNDGLAFCALMHSFIPNAIDYETLRHENNPVTIIFTLRKLIIIESVSKIHRYMSLK